jgi:hypothetical protein
MGEDTSQPLPTSLIQTTFPNLSSGTNIPALAKYYSDGTFFPGQGTLFPPPYIFAGTTGAVPWNYAIIVQVPIPFADLLSGGIDFNLLGDFVLPLLTRFVIPSALTKFLAKVNDFIKNVANDYANLVRAIPEASVSILVRVGPVTVVNILLAAEKVPVRVPIPVFTLSLPNFAIDPNFSFQIPFPVLPPVVIRIPVPIPIVYTGVRVQGGEVSLPPHALFQPFNVLDKEQWPHKPII